ncbi:MAG TPA: Mut7-C RNAse domain-containing protein, partial [Bacteroidales bacterium]|jgi:uncharacterized protein with PIN domain|nr:Mut7-C RNAse domain-containing protein [Bacteroidales bacterium]
MLKFIADVHLGKLARKLRLLGFDTYFESNLDDNEIIRMSLAESRIVLSRDKELINNSRITQGYRILSSDPREQIREVMIRFDLQNNLNPFSRCIDCNGMIENVSKESVNEYLPPKTRQYFDEFFRCRGCGKIYWEGSHYENMKKQIQNLPG